MNNFEPGSIVWAKTNKKYWPSIILSSNHVARVTRKNYLWVFWFGDYRVSEIRKDCIIEFRELFKRNRLLTGMGKRCSSGVYEALKAYGYPDTINWNNEKLMSWALNDFDSKPYNSEKYFPELVLEKLREMEKIKVNSPLKPIKNEMALNQKHVDVQTLCLGCYSDKIVEEHPVFEGNICLHCKENLIKTFFLIGEDNIHYCCHICGNFGEMLICSSFKCGRAYCYRCIDNLMSIDHRKNFINQKNWFCFFCAKYDLGLIKVHVAWMDYIDKIYQCKLYPIPVMHSIKRKIRVFSVFDGIASGLTALKKIHMIVDKYFASEIDPIAMNVAQKQHHNKIIYLGDIRTIDDEQLSQICPIDLFIGGSPCNELSLANPQRRGLCDNNGTGILFFEYSRLLTTLQRMNGRPFFWLFENVASMTLESKETISDFLDCEPVRVNAIWTSPQNRERFFWGNCPSLKTQLQLDGPKLQEYLLPGRSARMDQIQTITTRSNSLMQGSDQQYPVRTVKGELDILDIIEIERIFGFPDDYTNFENLSDTVRQQLIGRSWSVQVASMLFQFLKFYFSISEF